MMESPGFERSIQAIQAVKDHGWTYPSNFLDIYFQKMSIEENICWLDVGEHCLSQDGRVAWPALGVFVDVAFSNAARSALGQQASLATVSLQLSIKKRPAQGQLKAISRIKNTFDQSQINAVQTEIDVYAQEGELLASGSALMATAPFKNALDVPSLPQAAQQFLPWRSCVPEPSTAAYAIYQAARHALTLGDEKTFIDRFWAAQPVNESSPAPRFGFYKGEHLANRSGNVHGGILYGLAANAAHAIAPPDWVMSESTIQYLSAASEAYFETRTEVLRHGKNTMVVNCQIISNSQKKVLHSQWTFLKPKTHSH